MLHICNYGLWRTSTFFKKDFPVEWLKAKKQTFILTMIEFSNEHFYTLKITTIDSLCSK